MAKESTVLGLLAGTAIGVAIGLLFAPDKGENTRKRLVDEATALKDKINAETHDLKDKVAASVSDRKDTFENQLETIVSDLSYQTEDVITALETKLQALKEKNKTFQKS
ncbi:YtxH domain-containing protein [Bizionia sediminis]|uniref:YtxH domain-containing protein n=1 Tax=Bizionia sediminis TaxID=1737064 RepID=A0ABW5KQF3_9FLAO